jgi:hypothetical protein
MLTEMRRPAAVVRAMAGLATVLLLGGCGSSPRHATSAGVPERPCPQTVMETLGRVVSHVYHEGVASERTVSATRTVAGSAPLRAAVEAGDPGATTAAARALVAGGHLTDLRVVASGGRVLADVGGTAVAPLNGTIVSRSGQPIGTYTTSVWSDEGLLAESQGLAEVFVALRVHGHSVGGSLPLPPGRLPHEGTLRYRGVTYQYSSFGAKRYPSGAMRVYLLKPLAATRPLCGAHSEDTLVNTLERVALRIYAAEAGRRTMPQIRRVQAYTPLLQAVAARDAPAARAAVAALLTEHIVRMRVLVDGRLLTDVGGPYVLAPVSAPLRLGGRTIGSIVLSIQDDEGYLRLTRRLAGLRVLMYMDGQVVKNSLGPDPGEPAETGSYTYCGQRYRVFTVPARAFPSGPLPIRVLVPIPYT